MNFKTCKAMIEMSEIIGKEAGNEGKIFLYTDGADRFLAYGQSVRYLLALYPSLQEEEWTELRQADETLCMVVANDYVLRLTEECEVWINDVGICFVLTPEQRSRMEKVS